MWKTTRLFDFLENTKKGRPRIEYALTLDKVFSTWIRDRIAQYDFVENQDYISFHRKMERVVGGTILLKNQDFVWVSKNSET